MAGEPPPWPKDPRARISGSLDRAEVTVDRPTLAQPSGSLGGGPAAWPGRGSSRRGAWGRGGCGREGGSVSPEGGREPWQALAPVAVTPLPGSMVGTLPQVPRASASPAQPPQAPCPIPHSGSLSPPPGIPALTHGDPSGHPGVRGRGPGETAVHPAGLRSGGRSDPATSGAFPGPWAGSGPAACVYLLSRCWGMNRR